MILKLGDMLARSLVVLLQDPDEVRDGEHAAKLLLVRVPQGSRPDPVVHERVERLLHLQLRVEHDQLGRRRDEVVAFVEAEELDVDL